MPEHHSGLKSYSREHTERLVHTWQRGNDDSDPEVRGLYFYIQRNISAGNETYTMFPHTYSIRQDVFWV